MPPPPPPPFQPTIFLDTWPERLSTQHLLPHHYHHHNNKYPQHNPNSNSTSGSTGASATSDDDDESTFDFRSSIIRAFDLAQPGPEATHSEAEAEAAADAYVYHAMTARVTLRQVQEVVRLRERERREEKEKEKKGEGSGEGLWWRRWGWYYDVDTITTRNSSSSITDGGDGEKEMEKLPPPPPQDIEAYTSVFASTTSTTKALIGLEKNARKGSVRARVASHLTSLRQLPSSGITVPKLKTPHVNPYFDYWRWSCRHLDWAGPDVSTVHVRHSHHILPVLYLHFGCVCPSYESLQIIKQVARQRPVLEIGSGNGYWTLLLRRLGVVVQAVDNLESEWRTMWISDTIVADGPTYLKKHQAAKDAVLLMVYPVARSGFTSKVLESCKGDVVCVVGTQNRNGYTAFADTTIDEYVAEKMPDFQKTVQIPLPSFAGKDDALFVFERKSG